jgi:hypothetical protein
MTKNNLLFSLLILICHTVWAQNSESNLILGYSETQEMYFHEYTPALKIKADYTDIGQATNQYPEQLIQSILSARNQTWVDYNTLGGPEKSSKLSPAHFDRVSSMNKDLNYFELMHKMTFNLGNISTAVIKFYFYQENEKPLSGCYVMQFVDGRWQKTSHPSLSVLSIAFMRFKTEVIRDVITGRTTEDAILKLRGRVTNNGSLDLTKLEKEFSSWYSPTKDTNKLKLFTDPKAW